MTNAFVGANQWIAEKRGREEREADAGDVEQFESALALKMAEWFPDGPMTPWKQIFMAGAFITIEIQSAPPRRKLSSVPAAAPAAAQPPPSAPDAVSPSPPPAPPPPRAPVIPFRSREEDLDLWGDD